MCKRPCDAIMAPVVTQLPLLLLPGEIMTHIMREMAREELNWFIGLLYVNRDSFERLPHFLSLIIGPSLKIRLDDYGYHKNVYYKTLARYLAPSIESLSLDNYRGKTLTSSFIATSFTALRHLSLSETGTFQRPEDLSLMTQLRRLDLAYSKRSDFFDLSPQIYRLSGLKYLDLGNSTAINNNGLASLTGLVTLDLSHNIVIDGCALAGLTKLESLNLTSYRRLHLPRDIKHLTNLRELYLPFIHNESAMIVTMSTLSQLKRVVIKDATPRLLLLLRSLFVNMEIVSGSSSY